MSMKVYWDTETRNVGDTLTPHLLSFFLPDLKIRPVDYGVPEKLVSVGSILEFAIRPGDIVWGSGAMYCWTRLAHVEKVKFLSVRGRLTRERILECGGQAPEVYGDPGILLPLMYRPAVEKTCKTGYVPHFYDYQDMLGWTRGRKDCQVIDIRLSCREVIERILSCEKVICSSLHAIVIAEAYGIPAEWAVYSSKVVGNGFKFRDYLTGTDREPREPGPFPPITNLDEIQDRILRAANSIPYNSISP